MGVTGSDFVMGVQFLSLLWDHYDWHCYGGTVPGTMMSALFLVLLHGHYDWYCYGRTVIGNVIGAL